MNWISIVLSGIKLAISIMTYLNDRQLLKAGEDKAVARMALELLEQTAEGKALRDSIKGLSDQEVADLWDRMGKA